MKTEAEKKASFKRLQKEIFEKFAAEAGQITYDCICGQLQQKASERIVREAKEQQDSAINELPERDA